MVVCDIWRNGVRRVRAVGMFICVALSTVLLQHLNSIYKSGKKDKKLSNGITLLFKSKIYSNIMVMSFLSRKTIVVSVGNHQYTYYSISEAGSLHSISDDLKFRLLGPNLG